MLAPFRLKRVRMPSVRMWRFKSNASRLPAAVTQESVMAESASDGGNSKMVTGLFKDSQTVERRV